MPSHIPVLLQNYILLSIQKYNSCSCCCHFLWKHAFCALILPFPSPNSPLYFFPLSLPFKLKFLSPGTALTQLHPALKGCSSPSLHQAIFHLFCGFVFQWTSPKKKIKLFSLAFDVCNNPAHLSKIKMDNCQPESHNLH